MSNQNEPKQFLLQSAAAELICHSERTLEKWRVVGIGPPFLKLGRRVVYERAVLIAWAQSKVRTSTSDPGAAA